MGIILIGHFLLQHQHQVGSTAVVFVHLTAVENINENTIILSEYPLKIRKISIYEK